MVPSILSKLSSSLCSGQEYGNLFTYSKLVNLYNWNIILFIRPICFCDCFFYEYILSLYISVSIRVLYVANEEQTLSDAFPFVVYICLVWLCNCTKYHWNLYGRRTQRPNSTYVNTSCCICPCILLNLIIFRIPWRRRLQTTDAKG